MFFGTLFIVLKDFLENVGYGHPPLVTDAEANISEFAHVIRNLHLINICAHFGCTVFASFNSFEQSTKRMVGQW